MLLSPETLKEYMEFHKMPVQLVAVVSGHDKKTILNIRKSKKVGPRSAFTWECLIAAIFKIRHERGASIKKLKKDIPYTTACNVPWEYVASSWKIKDMPDMYEVRYANLFGRSTHIPSGKPL